MIGTIRKHSTWLWMIIIAAIIISFVIYFSPNQRMKGQQSTDANYGSIYGERVTRDAFIHAQHEAELRYLFTRHEWPDRNFDIERETYFQLFFIQKQEDMGIHVSLDAVQKIASEKLRELSSQINRGNPFPLEVFVKQFLQPRGMSVDDFERYFRHELGLQELIAMTSIGGTLSTPAEIRALYTRENEELSAQAVFFTASNYLSGVAVTPEAVAEFYTNRMANYRLPERVQVSFVKFTATNYLAEATKELAAITNLNELIDAKLQELGTNYFPEAKSLDEKKAKMRETALKDHEMINAMKQANQFAAVLYEIPQARRENLAAIATNGLTVEISRPFDREEGPKELGVGADFVRAAFALSAEEPYAGPIVGENAIYVIAPYQKLPSENPPFATVRDQVSSDYKYSQASALARKAGEAFNQAVTNGLAGGKSFAAICIAEKVKPVFPPPFAISTRALPEVESFVSLNQFKQAAFTTPIGKPSALFPMRDGAFVVFVSAKLPLDESKMRNDLPQFTRSVRVNRQNEAFNIWVNMESQRDPGFKQILQELDKRNRNNSLSGTR